MQAFVLKKIQHEIIQRKDNEQRQNGVTDDMVFDSQIAVVQSFIRAYMERTLFLQRQKETRATLGL